MKRFMDITGVVALVLLVVLALSVIVLAIAAVWTGISGVLA